MIIRLPKFVGLSRKKTLSLQKYVYIYVCNLYAYCRRTSGIGKISRENALIFKASFAHTYTYIHTHIYSQVSFAEETQEFLEATYCCQNVRVATSEGERKGEGEREKGREKQKAPVSFKLQVSLQDSSEALPQVEEIVLQIITTAKMSIKFPRESSCISNTFSRESPKFHTIFQLSKRNPRHSKHLSGKLIHLEIEIFEV